MGRKPQYPWDAMPIGAWFELPAYLRLHDARSMCSRAGAQRGKRFVVHVGKDGTLYVERTQ